MLTKKIEKIQYQKILKESSKEELFKNSYLSYDKRNSNKTIHKRK